jgi:hypothetical protein
LLIATPWAFGISIVISIYPSDTSSQLLHDAMGTVISLVKTAPANRRIIC